VPNSPSAQQPKCPNVKITLFFQNAWVDQDLDTRNVAVHEVIIEVEDVPDTPPYFLIVPPVTKLPETATIVSHEKRILSQN
jgi:hypothetical protein